MNLTPEQKDVVSTWVAGGDSLSAVQNKLREKFGISLTYMEVRLLVDDLDLVLKDPAHKPDTGGLPSAPTSEATNPAATRHEKKGLFDKAKEKLGLGSKSEEANEETQGDKLSEAALDEDAGEGQVQVEIDAVTLIPGAVASGKVTFSDGVTGKWIVDQYGRPGFTEISKPGYRPSASDAQVFMQELDEALRQKGF